MRFLLYDRVLELEKGRRILGVKSFALSEAYLEGHFENAPFVPGAILLEAMAQVLGWLIIFSHDFRCSAVISLIEKANLCPALRPGVPAEIEAEIVSSSRGDSLGKARILVNGEKVAQAERMIYRHFDGVDAARLKAQFSYYGGFPRDHCA